MPLLTSISKYSQNPVPGTLDILEFLFGQTHGANYTFAVSICGTDTPNDALSACRLLSRLSFSLDCGPYYLLRLRLRLRCYLTFPHLGLILYCLPVSSVHRR